MKTYDVLVTSKLVQHQAIDEEYCTEYDTAVSTGSDIALQIMVRTRTDCPIVSSPKFKKAEDALKWYEDLDFVDSGMFCDIFFFSQYGDICTVARLEDK